MAPSSLRMSLSPMNKAFRLLGPASFSLGVLLITCGSLLGQKPTAGFITLVNAVSLPTNTIIAVDGKRLPPLGLEPGKVTGGLGFTEGTHRIDASNGAALAVSSSIQISSVSKMVIIYSVRRKDAKGIPIEEIRMFSCPGVAVEKGRQFYVLYAGGLSSQQVSINGQSVVLSPLKEVAVGSAGSLSINQNGQPVADLHPEEPGNYLAIVFDGQDSKIKAVLARDIQYTAAGSR